MHDSLSFLLCKSDYMKSFYKMPILNSSGLLRTWGWLHWMSVCACTNLVQLIGRFGHRDNFVTWKHYIGNITGRASKILNLLRRHLYSCNQEVEKTFTSLVRPHLEYSSSVWDSYTNKTIWSSGKSTKRWCSICNWRLSTK